MREFNLKEALNGAEIVTRGGRKVTDFRLRDDANSIQHYPCIAKVDGKSKSFTIGGLFCLDEESDFDLFIADNANELENGRKTLNHSEEYTLNEYQKIVEDSIDYKGDRNIKHPTGSLSAEVFGVSKMVKDANVPAYGVFSSEDKREIANELSGVLLYTSLLANDLGYTLNEIAEMSIQRMDKNSINGISKRKESDLTI